MSAGRVRPVAVVALGCVLLLSQALPADAQGRNVGTIVGNPAVEGAGLGIAMSPFGLALSPDGHVLVADPANSVVRSLDVDSGAVTTVAGAGGGFAVADVGDGKPARQVQLGSPVSVAAAADGSYVIGDSGFGGSRVRYVSPTGVVRLLAGNGTQAFSGDDGPAVQAALYGAVGVAIASNGSVWISDTYSNRVRQVTADGRIRTRVGTGTAGIAGDGGPALMAELDEPKGLAFTATGELLIADSGNDRIRLLKQDGTLETVAGGGGSLGDGGQATAAALDAPSSARPTAGGGFVIADTLNSRVRRVAPDGTISTLAGDGSRNYGADDVPAGQTQLFAPEDALPLADGRMVIADTRASRVRIVGTDGVIHALAGNYLSSYSGDGGPGTIAQAAQIRRPAVAPSGDVFFVDYCDGFVIRRWSPADGTVHPVAGYGPRGQAPADGDSALMSPLHQPTGLAFTGDGALLVTDQTLVRRIDLSTGTQQLWAGSDNAGDSGDGGNRLDARFTRLTGVRPLPDGSILLVDTGAQRVRRVDPAGEVSAFAGTGQPGHTGDGGLAVNATLREPQDVVTAPGGTTYISEDDGGRMRAVSPGGIIRTVAGSGVQGLVDKQIPGPAMQAAIRPGALALLADGRVLMTDSFANSVWFYDPRGEAVGVFAGSGRSGYVDGDANTAELSFPDGIAVDPVRHVAYVGDSGNQRLRAVSFPDPLTPNVLAGARTSRTSTVYPGAVTVVGQLRYADGSPRSGGRAVLQYQLAGSATWTDLATVTADAAGALRSTRQPSSTMRFRWLSSDRRAAGNPSPTVVVNAVLTAAWSTSRIHVGQTAVLVGSLSPAHSGELLRVQRRYADGSWRTVATVRESSTGGYRWSYTAATSIDPTVRVLRLADSHHPVALSPVRTLIVA